MNGRVKEAERIVRKAARWNNVSYEEVIAKASLKAAETKTLLYNGADKMADTWGRDQRETGEVMELNGIPVTPETQTVQEKESKDYSVERYSIITVLRTRRLCVNSMIIWFSW